MAPCVSVLVPSYNKREHIEQTLKSIYDQRFEDWELIVVDDGSTDGSPALLESHRERATIILGDNRGASAARQRALEGSRGRFIPYLDADALILPDALERRVEALERTDGDVAYSDWQRFTSSTDGALERGAVVAQSMPDAHPDPEVACVAGFWAPPAALLYRRALIDRMPPWSEQLPVMQDARYLQEAALAGAAFVHVPGVSALYRDDAENSLSRRDELAFARDVVLNAEQITQVWRARGDLEPRHRSALASAHDYAARVAFRRDPELFQRALRQLRQLGELRPAGWPAVANHLRRALGTRGASYALALLRRPPG